MPIEVKCTCGQTFHVEEQHAGKRGKCPSCGGVVQIPKPSLSMRQTRGHVAQAQRLMLAQWIQQRLCAPSPLTYGPFDVAGMSVPSSQAGGDYFDLLNLQDGSLGIVIGDASGHGVESAFLMAQIRLCLRTLAQSSADVGQIFDRANRLLLGELPPDTFATIAMARLDEQTRRLTYVGAGQPPAFILNRDGKIETVLKSGEQPLGLAAEARYASSEPVQVNPGDAVLFLTRGILRAPATDGRPIGSQRLLGLVHANQGKPASVILETMHNVVLAANKNRPATDDLTAVLVMASAAA